MLKKIEALRLQPKYVRTRFAFTVSFFITCIIAVIWGYSMFDKFTPDEPTTEIVEVESSLSRFLGDMKQSLVARIQLLKPTTEYVRETPIEPKTEFLDFDSMVASSAKQKRDMPTFATTTDQTTKKATSSGAGTAETVR